MAEDEEYNDWVVEPPHDADEPDSGSDTGGSPGSGDNGGSSSSGGGTDDESTSVVVTGDPGSSEEQEVVGQGDTMEEARADAATNPDFDADEGDPVDDVEESLGTDQPEINPDDQQSEETNVVVTGDPGSRQRQRVVGRGQTRQGARVQAAANQRFDAAEGTRTDAIEEELGQGQGDDTTFQETRDQLKTRGEKDKEEKDKEEKEKVETSKPEFNLFETAQQLQLEREAREDAVEQAAQESGLAGTFTIRGVQLMQEGQRLSEDAAELVGTGENIIETGFDAVDNVAPENERVQDTLDLAEEGAQEFQESTTRSTALGSGLALSSQAADTVRSGDLTVEDAGEIMQSSSLNTVSNTQTDVREDFSQGVGTLGTQLGGLAIATPGAVVRATRDDTPSLEEGAVEGVRLTGEEVSEDPGQFLSEEAGEEVGEALVGAAAAGPAGLALGATPVPEITPGIEARAVETERFMRGDLGTQVENERVVQKPFPAEGDADAAFFERQTEQLEDGGRAQQAVQVDPAEETVTVGQREERPVTRRDVLRDNLEAGRQEVDRFLDGNAVGIGPGGLLPEESTTPETEPDTLPDQELFEETQSGGDTFVEDVSTPGRTRPSSIEQGLEEETGLGEEQVPGLNEEQGPEEEPPVQEFRQETVQETEPGIGFEVEFIQEPEQEPEQFIETRPEIEPEAQPTPGLGEDNNQGFFDAPAFEEEETGSEPVASPDLTSLVFGGGEENVGGVENPATGLERRAPNTEEEENFENDGFLNQF